MYLDTQCLKIHLKLKRRMLHSKFDFNSLTREFRQQSYQKPFRTTTS